MGTIIQISLPHSCLPENIYSRGDAENPEEQDNSSSESKPASVLGIPTSEMGS